MVPKWRVELEKQLINDFGEEYAQRVLDHLSFVLSYTGYGAPGHMHYILIQELVKLFNQDRFEVLHAN